jgi:hypothetical protein
MALDLQNVTEEVASKVFASMNPSPLTPDYDELTAIQKHYFKESMLPLITHVVPVAEKAVKDHFEGRINTIISDGREDGQSDADILMSIQLAVMLG